MPLQFGGACELLTTHRRKNLTILTLILLTWTIWRVPTNASKWRMRFNSAFKGLRNITQELKTEKFKELKTEHNYT